MKRCPRDLSPLTERSKDAVVKLRSNRLSFLLLFFFLIISTVIEYDHVLRAKKKKEKKEKKREKNEEKMVFDKREKMCSIE